MRILAKSPLPFFVCAEIDKLILKFTWKCKRPRIAKTILKKSKVGGSFSPISKCHEASLTETLQHWHKDSQWNRNKSPERSSYVYGQLMSSQVVKIIQRGKRIIFSTNGAQITGYPHSKE